MTESARHKAIQRPRQDAIDTVKLWMTVASIVMLAASAVIVWGTELRLHRTAAALGITKPDGWLGGRYTVSWVWNDNLVEPSYPGFDLPSWPWWTIAALMVIQLCSLYLLPRLYSTELALVWAVVFALTAVMTVNVSAQFVHADPWPHDGTAAAIVMGMVAVGLALPLALPSLRPRDQGWVPDDSTGLLGGVADTEPLSVGGASSRHCS